MKKMLPRVIPCMLLKHKGFVKTVKFKNPTYLGDPINVVKLFNDKEVDEIVILDITATPEGRGPAFDFIARVAGECFMPLGFGGGIRSLDDIRQIFNIGVEKAIINSYAVERPDFIRAAAERFGSQSIVVSMDVKRSLLGTYEIYTHGGQKATGLDPVRFATLMAEHGAGEIIVNSIDRDGTMQGYDLALIKRVADAVPVPVIACGGAGSMIDFGRAVSESGASAVAAGSLFVFQGRHRAVLISFPSQADLQKIFAQGA